MYPKENKPQVIYRVIHRTTNNMAGAYSRATCTEYDFNSPDEARSSLLAGTYQDKDTYRVDKYRVHYELVAGDCDVVDSPYIYPTDEVIELRAQELYFNHLKLNPVQHEYMWGQCSEFYRTCWITIARVELEQIYD